MNTCYIVGAFISGDLIINKKENDMIIASDGGYDYLKKYFLKPDIIIGDMDSIENCPVDVNSIKFPVEKDDTDTILAYNYGLSKHYSNFVIYGGVGGRLDHTLANIQLLIRCAKDGKKAFLMGSGYIITAIHNSKIKFSSQEKGTISVFAAEKSKGVTIEGLKYNLKNGDLNVDYPLGVSNSFINKNSTISVDCGTLVILWYTDTNNFQKRIDFSMINPS